MTTSKAHKFNVNDRFHRAADITEQSAETGSNHKSFVKSLFLKSTNVVDVLSTLFYNESNGENDINEAPTDSLVAACAQNLARSVFYLMNCGDSCCEDSAHSMDKVTVAGGPSASARSTSPGDLITIRSMASDIPKYLHASAFYRTLDVYEDAGGFQVPATCLYHSGDVVEDLDDFEMLLHTMLFWGVDAIPRGIIRFCFEHPHSEWKAAAAEVLGVKSPIRQVLSAVFIGAPKDEALLRAIAAGDSEVVEVLAAMRVRSRGLKRRGRTDTSSAESVLAAKLGRLDMLRILKHNGYQMGALTCKEASGRGALACLKFAHEQGGNWDTGTLVRAALHGHLDCLVYAHKEGLDWSSEVTCKATEGNQLACLKYLHKNGCAWDERVVAEAAKRGFVDCLQYALQHGCPVGADACTKACIGGHIACLQLLFQHHALWDCTTATAAARHNQLACLQFLHENGCPWGEATVDAAASNGHLHVLRYAIDNHCPRGLGVVKLAAGAASLSCLVFLVEDRGLLMSADVFVAALCTANYDCVAFLVDAGCPFPVRFRKFSVGESVRAGLDYDAELRKCIEYAWVHTWAWDITFVQFILCRKLPLCASFVQVQPCLM